MWKQFIFFCRIMQKWFIVKNNNTKTIYCLSSRIGVAIFCRDISSLWSVIFLQRCNCNCNVVRGLPWLIIFCKYPIDIGKRLPGLLFLLWRTGRKGYWVHYPSLFCRTYRITLHIVMLYGILFPVLLSLFFRYATKATANHESFCSTLIHMQSRKTLDGKMGNWPLLS